MSWTDGEIDDLFSDAANEQHFDFKHEYFKDIEKQLPVNRSFKPSLWWLTGGLFIVMFSSLGVVEFSNNEFSHPTPKVNLSKSAVKPIDHTAQSHVPENKVEKDLFRNGSVNPQLKEVSEDRMRTLTSPEINNPQPTKEDKLSLKDVLENEPTLTSITTLDVSNQPVTFVNESEKVGALELVALERTVINEIPLAEVTNFVAALPELSASKTFSSKSNSIKVYVELTGGMEQGWTKNESGNSVNGSVGARFGMVLPVSRFKLSAGVGVEAKKLNNLQIKERTKIYNFGYSTYEHIYQFSSIYSVHAPLSLSYSVKRHSFELGIDPSFNLFTRLNRSELLDDLQVVERSGISDVSLFSKFGASANIGYGYAVNENLQIGCRMNMQLIQPISSDRFYGSSVSKPIEGQVFIRRTLDF